MAFKYYMFQDSVIIHSLDKWGKKKNKLKHI